MMSKKIFAIVFLLILFGPTFTENSAMGQNNQQQSYCPQTVEKKYCHKVIIIGAGMAGLGAANELKSNGFDALILESSPAKLVGGRVITENDSRTHYIPIDLHASEIAGTIGNPITELAQKYNSSILQTWNNYTYYDHKGLIGNPQISNNLNNVWSKFTKWLHVYRIGKTEDESLQIAINKFNDTLGENDKKSFSYDVSSYIGNTYADDAKYLSLLYWDKIGYIVGGPSGTISVFANGFASIPEHLASDLGNGSIQYNTLVTKISYGQNGVQIDTKGGPSYYGKYVICTIPTYLLQGDHPSITFDPALPQNKTDAINKMLMGTLTQTYILFNKTAMPANFWNSTTDYVSYVPPMTETGHWTLFMNLYKTKHQPLLLAWNYGDYARQMLTEPEYQIKQEMSNVFKIMNGSNNFDTKSITILYKGAKYDYSTSPIGFKVPNDFDMLASPVADNNGTNRVFFAGEATTWHYPATTDGAFLTGLREANRVMVTDTGKYPNPLEQENNWRYPPDPNGKHTWLTFPEYVMCKPGHTLVLKNDAEKTPMCVNPDIVESLFDKHLIINPTLP